MCIYCMFILLRTDRVLWFGLLLCIDACSYYYARTVYFGLGCCYVQMHVYIITHGPCTLVWASVMYRCMFILLRTDRVLWFGLLLCIAACSYYYARTVYFGLGFCYVQMHVYIITHGQSTLVWAAVMYRCMFILLRTDRVLWFGLLLCVLLIQEAYILFIFN